MGYGRRGRLGGWWAVVAIWAFVGCEGDDSGGASGEGLDSTTAVDVGGADADVADATGGPAPDLGPAEPDAGRAPTEALLRVDFTTAAGPTGRLIGWNVGRGTLYGPADSPTHPEWRTARRTEAAALLRGIRAATGEPPYVRFSGLQIDGRLGQDGYHFWDFVDPDRAITDDDNMAPFEYFALMDEVESTPLVTVNFGTGTAAEAGDYLQHLEGVDAADPLVTARAHWGRAEPYGVRTFEIGNESYGQWNTGYGTSGASYAAENGDPDWIGQPSSDPVAFTARALTYVEAMTARVPDAHIWVPLAQASMEGWGGLEEALEVLRPLLEHPSVRAVVVHHYHVDDTALIGGVNKNDPQHAMTLSESYRPGFDDLRARLGTLERDVPMEIAITEYHVAGAFARGRFNGGDQAVMGLGIADMLVMYAQLGIEHACQHMALNYQAADDPHRDILFEPWYPPFRKVDDGPLQDRAHATVTRMFAEHLRRDTIAVEVERTPETPGVAAPVPAVHATAFADDASGTLFLLHRRPDGPTTMRVEVPAGWTATAHRAFAPASPEEQGPFEVVDRPMSNAGDGWVEVTLPPRSVVGLTFSAT